MEEATYFAIFKLINKVILFFISFYWIIYHFLSLFCFHLLLKHRNIITNFLLSRKIKIMTFTYENILISEEEKRNIISLKLKLLGKCSTQV